MQTAGEGDAISRSEFAHGLRTALFTLAFRGYDVGAVDEWLEAAAVAITSPVDAATPSLVRPSFSLTLRGYERHGVDAMVDQVMTYLGDATGLDFSNGPTT